jgi:hypothetical protein
VYSGEADLPKRSQKRGLRLQDFIYDPARDRRALCGRRRRDVVSAAASLRVLDGPGAARVRELCEAIVPGSGRVAPEVYVDALLAEMAEPDRVETLAALFALAPDVDDLGSRAGSPEFQRVRALACEAFYSDFVAPGAAGPGAWVEIDFSFPLADRVVKDWSFMGIER